MADAPRPAPMPDAVTAPFWESCARHELRLQECRACGKRWLPASVVCPRCWSDRVVWVVACGEGTVATFAVYHRAYHEAFRPRLPYVVAVVALAEGPHLVSNIVGIAPERVRVGMPVRVEFEAVEGTALPVFRPAGEGG
jgi:uncharacterized protein